MPGAGQSSISAASGGSDPRSGVAGDRSTVGSRPGSPSARSTPRPRAGRAGASGTTVRGRCARPAGMCRRASSRPLLPWRPRRGRPGRSRVKTPLTTRCWLRDAEAASSPLVRSASRRAAGLGPADEDERGRRPGRPGPAPCPGRASAGPASPASGPRHEVPVVLSAMNPSQARRQRQQPQRVPGRGGVEEDVVELRRGRRRRPAGGRTRRTRRSRACRSRRTAPPCSATAASGSTPAVRGRPSARGRLAAASSGSMFIAHRSGHAGDRRRALPPASTPSTSSRLRRRVGADQQHPLARVGQGDGRGTGHARSCRRRPCR